ncbi:MAG: type II toxin-antitoxin system RelE/ParE family toxin [Planctomycetaceae bacterium]|nr:type II toxin-antitoxin system RelE/ParE family toxin [Planctomycetaceae bacterium]
MVRSPTPGGSGTANAGNRSAFTPPLQQHPSGLRRSGAAHRSPGQLHHPDPDPVAGSTRLPLGETPPHACGGSVSQESIPLGHLDQDELPGVLDGPHPLHPVHFADRSLDTALRFAAAAEAALSRLAESPRIGHPRPCRDPILRQVRSWPVPGFEDILLFHRPSARGIDVLRILHGARDLPALLG